MREVKPDAVRLGRAIAQVRARAGLSPFDLGVAVGLSESEILAHEAGTRAITMARLRAVALACGTSSAKLLEDSHPLPTDLDTAQWRELAALFAQLDEGSRDALVRLARQLRDREGRR